MNNMNIMSKIHLIFFMVFLMIVSGCVNHADAENTNSSTNNNMQNKNNTVKIDKLEIYHFHGTNQCYSCITVGDYAEATVNTYFKEELEKGIIVFDHINGELPENRDLVMKYGATGSSLWLGTYKGEEFTPEQNIQVWYKIKDKEGYMNYLKGVIEQKLAGDN